MSDDLDALVRALPDRVNGHGPLRRIGRHCTTEFLLEVGERPYHLVIDRGYLEPVIRGPRLMRAWAFALRADTHTWRRFWDPLPAPGFNDLFAMARYRHLRIEGDVGPLLTHLRYLKEVVALPRLMLAEAAA